MKDAYTTCGGGGYIIYCSEFWEFSLVGGGGGHIIYCGEFWKFSLVWDDRYIIYYSGFWEFSLIGSDWFCK